MKVRKRIIHYKLSSILMIIGITVSFVCFFNCINLYHLLIQKKTEQEQYRYTSEIGMNYVNYSGAGKLTDLITSEQGNIILKDATLYRDSMSADGITDIIVCQNEPLIYPLEAGSLPQSEAEITEPTVILGRSQRQYAVYENGDYYYTLEGIKCRVCAFVGSSSSDLYNYNVIVYYKSLDERAKEKIDSIEDVLLGEDVSGYTSKQLTEVRKNHISFVFQNFALMPDYTVYENVEVPLLAKNIRRKERKQNVFDKLELLGIKDLANKRPSQISGGQQQRAAIARALVADNPIILADEPTGALDQKTSQDLMKLFKTINAEGKTIILITHDRAVAECAGRIVHIVDGKLEEELI